MGIKAPGAKVKSLRRIRKNENRINQGQPAKLDKND
jgi:hypothetical protein